MLNPAPLPDRHETFANIRLFCADVDGVLSDGGLYYGPDGNVMVRFNVLDGHGLKQLNSLGIITCFVTMSDTPQIRKRAQDLGINYCFSGVKDKVESISHIVKLNNLSWDQVSHIADDLNDSLLLKKVGIPVAVPNAVPQVLAICRYVTSRSGGQGAVRELCDAITASYE